MAKRVKRKKAKLSKEVIPTPPKSNKIIDMTDAQRMHILNGCHRGALEHQ
jgi:hypothetical protein